MCRNLRTYWRDLKSGVVTSLWARRLAGAKDFSVLHKFPTDSGAISASRPVTNFFSAVKHPKHEAGHLGLRKSGTLPKLIDVLVEH